MKPDRNCHQNNSTPPNIVRLTLLIVATVLFVVIVGMTSLGVKARRPAPPTPQVSVTPPDAQSTTGPIPPRSINIAGIAITSATSVTISGVPAYSWRHGCGPTAAGMVIGYWDSHGFDALVPGDAFTQTAAVNEMIASEGIASNYTDYCEPLDYYPNLLLDLSESPTGDEHPDECVADYMKTSQSYHYNLYGWSWFSPVGSAMKDYAHQTLGSSDHLVFTEDLYTLGDGSLNWDSFRAELDAGRPMVLLVDTDANGDTDHFVTAIGYDVIATVPHYACLNTWDDSIHWFEFAPIVKDQDWGIFGGVTFRILPLPNHVYCPLVMQD